MVQLPPDEAWERAQAVHVEAQAKAQARHPLERGGAGADSGKAQAAQRVDAVASAWGKAGGRPALRQASHRSVGDAALHGVHALQVNAEVRRRRRQNTEGLHCRW